MQVKDSSLSVMFLAAAFAGLFFPATEAAAQTAAPDETAAAAAPAPEQTVVMTPFDVDESNDQGYHSTNTAAITRLADPIQNLPVDVQVLNQTVINDMAVTQASELGRFIVASQDHGSSGTAATIFDMRGFTSGIPDDQQRDGFRFTGIENLYNIDRLEVIMGPNSVVQGAADPGGQVNVITKSAQTRQEFTTITAQGGSFGAYRGAIDSNYFTRTGNNDFAIRVNAVYEHTPTFIKWSDFDFRGIALALKDDLGRNTTLEARGEFMNEFRVPWANIADRWSGAPGLNGGFDMALNRQIPKIYDYDEANATAGPDAIEKHRNGYLEGQLTHRFSDNLNFFVLGEYSNELEPELLTPSLSPTIGYNATSNSYYVSRAYAWSRYSDDRYNVRALLNYDLNVGWMDQDFIAGYSEMWVQDETLQDNLDANGGSSAVVDQTPLSPTAFTYANYGLFDQLAGRHWGAIAPVADHVSNPSYYINSTGTYLNGKVKTIVGYSWNSSSRTDYTFAVPAGSFYQGTAALLPPTKSVAYTQKADIPMASIVIAVTPHINYFVDYSKSYKPQTLYEPTLNLATGAVEGSLGPQTGVGYDSGFKFDYTRTTGISGSIDAYDVTEQNVSQVLNTNIVAALLGQAASLQQRYYVGGTAQRDRGIEVQFFYNPSPSWSVYWNYAYSSAFISQSLEQPSLVGEEANDHSKNDFNLFAKYTYIDGPLKGWFLGPSVSARSRYYRIQANEYGYNAGYGVLNGLVGYSGKWGTTRYTVQINVENVFNKIYVRTYALIGEPREFTLSARLSF